MARPSTITDDQILSAARAVFLERGVQGTTAEVARRAGVAEGSIFKRFPTKHQLFLAALDPGRQDLPWMTSLGDRLGKGDVRAHLVELGLELVGFFRQLMPLWMMSWSSRAPEVVEDCIPVHLREHNSRPVRGIRAFAQYLDGEMRLGRMKRHDCETIARTFAGALQNFVFFELVLRTTNEMPMTAEEFVRNLVSVLWGGLSVPKKKAAAVAARRALPAKRKTVRR